MKLIKFGWRVGCTARDMSAGVSGRGGAKNHVGFTSAVRRMLLLLLLGILRSHIIIHRCTSLHCGRRAASELDYIHISFSHWQPFSSLAATHHLLSQPTRGSTPDGRSTTTYNKHSGGSSAPPRQRCARMRSHTGTQNGSQCGSKRQRHPEYY